jgi:serine protease Do
MFRLPAPSYRPFASLLAFAVLLGYQGQALAQRTPLVRNSAAVVAAFKPVVAKPAESTVRVLSDNEQLALGTIISADGYIVTKASELRAPLSCKLHDGRTFTARIVGIEDNHDLALLKIGASRLKPVEWRAAKTAEVGQWVAAPNPDGEPVAIGVVSVGVRRPSEIELMMPRTLPRQNSGYLGVRLGEQEDGSPAIVEVTEGSPAEKAGLKEKDIVISVGGRVVRTRDRLIAIIQTLKPGQEVSIKVKREDEEPLTVKVKLARFPQTMFGRSERMNMMGSELSHRLGGFPVILQHDLLIKPHDCGGPLVDLDGKALGVNIARAGRTESYALPAEAVQALLPELKSGSLAPPDESDEGRVAQLEAVYRKVRGELTRLENLAKTLTGEQLEAAKRRVGELRKRLQRTKDELEKARKEQARR